MFTEQKIKSIVDNGQLPKYFNISFPVGYRETLHISCLTSRQLLIIQDLTKLLSNKKILKVGGDLTQSSVFFLQEKKLWSNESQNLCKGRCQSFLVLSNLIWFLYFVSKILFHIMYVQTIFSLITRPSLSQFSVLSILFY